MRYLALVVILVGCGPAERASMGDADPDPITDTIVPDDSTPDSPGEGPGEDEALDDVEVEPECTVYYEDGDGDGYGGQNEACLESLEEGYVENSDDCCDDLAAVHPGQETYFGEPYVCPEEGNFDYNCDTVIERVYENEDRTPRDCEYPSCVGTGWYPAYPECGETANYGTCHLDGRFCRSDLDFSGLMRCR